MRIFRFCSLLLLLCGCQDVLSPQLRRLPVSEIREQGNKLVLNVSGRRVVLFKESSCAVIDGIPVQLCDAVKMKNVVELIFSRSEGKDPLGGERPIPPKWFCN